MKIAIMGYGRMGQMVENVLQERGHEIIVLKKDATGPEGADVIIEFTRPQAVIENLKKAMTWNTPIVTGTTGWNEELQSISKLVKENKGSIFYASNFSIGVHVFLEANAHLAKLMNPHHDYSPSIEEIHHTGKVDSPSGTAITLAERLLNQLDSKNAWANEKVQDTHVLAIHSERVPDVPGTHTVTYESDIDKIEFSHTAKGRRGFALGAVTAAEWLVGKQGLYTMTDMLKIH